jgi:hypothetical protein
MLSAKSFALVFIDLQQTWIGGKQKLAQSMSNQLPLSIFFIFPFACGPKHQTALPPSNCPGRERAAPQDWPALREVTIRSDFGRARRGF